MSRTESAVPTNRLQTGLAGDVVLLNRNRPIVVGKSSAHQKQGNRMGTQFPVIYESF